MSEFANTTCLVLSGGVASVLVDAVGADIHNTDTIARPILGDLARLKYIEGTFRGEFYMNTAEAAEIDFLLVADGVTLGTVTVNPTAAKNYWAFRLDNVNLVNVGPASKIGLQIDIATAAGTVTNAIRVSAVLDVKHPIIIS